MAASSTGASAATPASSTGASAATPLRTKTIYLKPMCPVIPSSLPMSGAGTSLSQDQMERIQRNKEEAIKRRAAKTQLDANGNKPTLLYTREQIDRMERNRQVRLCDCVMCVIMSCKLYDFGRPLWRRGLSPNSAHNRICTPPRRCPSPNSQPEIHRSGHSLNSPRNWIHRFP